LLRQGRKPEALNEALMAAVIDPDNAAAYSHLGHVFHVTGDAAAETALRRAARLDPKNAHVRHQLSDVYNAQERIDEAIAAAREATELEPGNPHRFVHLARLFLKANNPTGAEAAQRQAVQMEPGNIVSRLVLSDILARQGRYEAALVEAKTAAEHQPNSAHALGHLAHVLQLLKDFDLSEKLYHRAIALAPESDHLRRQLAYVRERRAQAVTA
jgi:superkiller protein 3